MFWFLTGMFVGSIVEAIVVLFISRRLSAGNLRVDRSDPYDGPYLFLELHKSIEDTAKNSHVILKVKEEDFVPRK